MTINDSRLLKGTLRFGEAAAPGGQAEGQITNLIVEQQDGDSEDAEYVLSGESTGGGETPGPWHATGTAIQDFDARPSLQQWSYQNRGTVQAFEFTPNDKTTAPHITGQIRVRFLGLGGDVRVRITRDFDWSFEGEPEFEWPEAPAGDAAAATTKTATAKTAAPALDTAAG